MVEEINSNITDASKSITRLASKVGQVAGAVIGQAASAAAKLTTETFTKSDETRIIELQKELITTVYRGDSRKAQQIRNELGRLNASSVSLPPEVREEYLTQKQETLEAIAECQKAIENAMLHGDNKALRQAQAEMRKFQTTHDLYNEFLGSSKSKVDDSSANIFKQNKANEYTEKIADNLETIAQLQQRVTDKIGARDNEVGLRETRAELLKHLTLHKAYKEFLNYYEGPNKALKGVPKSLLPGEKIAEYTGKHEDSLAEIGDMETRIQDLLNDKKTSDDPILRQALAELNKWKTLASTYQDFLSFYMDEMKPAGGN